MDFVTPSDQPTANVMLYGPPKAGKSIAAGTSPPGVLYLNADLPNATRQVHLRNPGKIFEVRLPKYDKGKQQLLPMMAEIANMVMDPEQTKYRTVVVDPVGEFYRRLLEEHAMRAIRPSLNIYGDVGVHIERFCRMLCEAPINAVIVCHELAQKDEGTGEFQRIAFTGSKAGSETLSQKLMGMVDVVAYTGVIQNDDGTTSYKGQLVAGKGRQGGDRFACLESVEDLDISKWIEKIEKYEVEEHGAQNGKKRTKPEVHEAVARAAAKHIVVDTPQA